ncbi:hypothetical protein AgCh_030941 [Apium graveolens]
MGFKQCPYEHSVYVKKFEGKLLIVALYVDDLIFMGNCQKLIEEFKKGMTCEFEMTDLGLLKYFLGLEIKHTASGIFMSQERPDLAFSVGMSKKQPIVTLSTCEAEYVAASWCVCHAIWLNNLLKEIDLPQDEAFEIKMDSKSTIELAKNPVHHERSKHIDVRFHFIREKVAENKVTLTHVKSRDQIADMFTKPLSKLLLYKFMEKIGMKKGSQVPASVRVRRESAVPKLKPKPPSLASAATLPKAPPAVAKQESGISSSAAKPQSTDDSYMAFLEDMKELGALD